MWLESFCNGRVKIIFFPTRLFFMLREGGYRKNSRRTELKISDHLTQAPEDEETKTQRNCCINLHDSLGKDQMSHQGPEGSLWKLSACDEGTFEPELRVN